jgi:hypothetical protein
MPSPTRASLSWERRGSFTKLGKEGVASLSWERRGSFTKLGKEG